MALQYTPSWMTDERYIIQRQYNQCIVVGWWEHSLISSANPIVIQEVPYGGYQLHIQLDANYRTWNSSQWYHEQTIVDIWATLPSSTTKVNAGTILRQYHYIDLCRVYSLQCDSPADGHYSFFKMPVAPSDYWHINSPIPSWDYQYRTPAMGSTPCPPDDLPIT